MKNPPSNPAFVLACHLARAILDTPNPNGISEYISLAPSPYKDILKALAFAPHAERGILFDNQTQAHQIFGMGLHGRALGLIYLHSHKRRNLDHVIE